MRKVLTAGVAALTLAGALAVTAAPAEAAPWGYYHHYGYWRGDGGGAALAAGVLGLAAGAAIASSSHPYYGYYGGPYYAGGPYYGGPYYGYGMCVSHRRVWDPYLGGYVVRSFRYAC